MTRKTEIRILKQNRCIIFLWNAVYSSFLCFFNFIPNPPYCFNIFRFIQRVVQFFPQMPYMDRNRIIRFAIIFVLPYPMELSPEMLPFERKLNAVKKELEKQKTQRANSSLPIFITYSSNPTIQSPKRCLHKNKYKIMTRKTEIRILKQNRCIILRSKRHKEPMRSGARTSWSCIWPTISAPL